MTFTPRSSGGGSAGPGPPGPGQDGAQDRGPRQAPKVPRAPNVTGYAIPLIPLNTSRPPCTRHVPLCAPFYPCVPSYVPLNTRDRRMALKWGAHRPRRHLLSKLMLEILKFYPDTQIRDRLL